MERPDLAIPTDRTQFEMMQCNHPECRLRFPVMVGDPRGKICPACRSETHCVLPAYPQASLGVEQPKPNGPELEVLLDNIRSAWNVGSMFRSADGAGVRKVHLAGICTPADHPAVAKTSLGAEKVLPWQMHPDGLAAARQMKKEGFRLWALEGGPRAEPLFDQGPNLAGAPLVLVVGNEVCGVDPEILAECERVVFLPMTGFKGSLNVAIAFGIAVYYLRYGNRRENGG